MQYILSIIAVSSLIIFSSANAYSSQALIALKQLVTENQLKIVPDTTQKKIDSILLFASDERIFKMHLSLIQNMGPDVSFHIVVGSNQTKDIYSKFILENTGTLTNIAFYYFNKCFTPWSQDMFLRMNNENNFFLFPTFSTNLIMNECKPFELGISTVLKKNNSKFSEINSKDIVNISRVDAKNGDIYEDSPYYKNLFPIESMKIFYGEGGMRIPTEKYLFIERTDVDQILKKIQYYAPNLDNKQAIAYFEDLFQKRIIRVGESLQPNTYYSYHIDMFMTPTELKNGDTVIFLGHPEETEKILGTSEILKLPGYQHNLWNQSKKRADLIERELSIKGFKIQRIPILFLDINNNTTVISMNNLLQTQNRDNKPLFLVPDYDIPAIKKQLEVLKKETHEIFMRFGIYTQFIQGGEKLTDLNGQLRCSSGVLKHSK